MRGDTPELRMFYFYASESIEMLRQDLESSVCGKKACIQRFDNWEKWENCSQESFWDTLFLLMVDRLFTDEVLGLKQCVVSLWLISAFFESLIFSKLLEILACNDWLVWKMSRLDCIVWCDFSVLNLKSIAFICWTIAHKRKDTAQVFNCLLLFFSSFFQETL